MDFLDRIRTRAELRRRGRYLGERLGKGWCFIQGDQNIANQAGAAFRGDLNTELQALVTNSQGASAPSTTYRNQWWHDTTANVVKRRNAANSAWIVRDTLDETFVLSRSSNTILGLSDYGKTIVATSTFTQTLTAAATLSDGWWCEYRNDGTGIITLDPNASEQVDGATTIALYPGESCVINCNGSAFKTEGRGTGWVLIATGTASASASLDFTNLTGFAAYAFVLENIIPATNSVELWLRISQDNGSSFKAGATDYKYAHFGSNDAAANGSTGSTGAAQIMLAVSTISNDANNGVSGQIITNDLAATKRHTAHTLLSDYSTSASFSARFGMGAYVTDTTAINAIRFLFSSGNISTGTIKCYGIRS